MERHHEDELTRRIEAVAYDGVVQIHWWELKAWYETDEIDDDVWRDLDERFHAVAESDDFELYTFESNGCVTLIHSDGLKKISEKYRDEDEGKSEPSSSAPSAPSTPAPTSVPTTR